MRIVSGSYPSFGNGFLRGGFEIVRPSNFSEEIDKMIGGIPLALFAGSIVPRERMVVVVPAFAVGHNGNE